MSSIRGRFLIGLFLVAFCLTGQCVTAQPLDGKLVITVATFGDLDGEKTTDVTAKITAMVKDNSLSVLATKEAFGDPAPNTPKKLKVGFTINGIYRGKTVDEGDVLDISTRLVIVKAMYGAPKGKSDDVTQQLADLVRKNTLSIQASNENFGDPANGVVKSLRVEYLFDGVRKTAAVNENQTLKLPINAPPATAPAKAAAVDYQTRTIEGWTIHIHPQLLAEHPAMTAKAIDLITGQLKEIVRVVPAEPLAHLQAVPLWINPEYPKIPPRAEYHPGGGWLRANGRNPAMAKSVEITNIRIFPREAVRMPCLLLHELSHAYHDQVLGFDQPDILTAYQHAVESKSYDKVERFFGDRPNTFERAYAMTTPREYFAETTEAFFGRNDFYPFNAEELQKHDPEMFKLLTKVWKVSPEK